MQIKSSLLRSILMPALLMVICQQAEVAAQSVTLSKPTRTVYKCTVDGKIAYSDEPCLGAQRIDVEPTRGLNKTTGREVTGQDVLREKQREQFAAAVKPLTGMSPKQLEVQTRRYNLSPEYKAECNKLDASIAENETQERSALGNAKPPIQQSLFVQRKRYRELKC